MNEKILIAEDNPTNMRLVQMILRGKGYTLRKATNGEEALEVALKERPDLVVMDVQLPKLSGLEVIRKLRQTSDFSRVPVIAVTAYAMKGDKEKFIKAGFDAYMSKPLDVHGLPLVIAGMLEQKKKSSFSIGVEASGGNADGKKNCCH
jgi:two-component system cell cycle response regulator DivK